MKATSIVLGATSILLMIASAAIAYWSFYVLVASKGSNAGAVSVFFIITIILIVIALLSALCGCIFGAIALFTKPASKIPAIIGLSLSLFSILSFLATVIYGFIWLGDNVKGRPFG